MVEPAPVVAVESAPPQLDASAALAALTDLTCTIRYVDAADTESVRRITLRKVEADFEVYVHAYCHERAAARCFRLDRIKESWDCQTGELIDLEALIRTFAPKVTWGVVSTSVFDLQSEVPARRPEPVRIGGQLINTASLEPPRRERSPVTTPLELKLTVPDGFAMPEPEDHRPELQPRAPERVAMARRCGDGLRVLRFLALCDGSVDDREVAAENGFCLAMCRGSAVDMDEIWCDLDFLGTYARRLRPTPETMLAAFGNIIARGNPAEVKLLLDYALLLIQADGQLSEEEVHFAGELTRILQSLEAGPSDMPTR